MSIIGTLLKNKRAGEANLAWNLPALGGADVLELTSEAFADGTAIPVDHVAARAGGRELSPPLAWGPVPAGTTELLLVAEDVDAPMNKPFVHCVALISPSVTALGPGALARQAPAPGVRVLRPTAGRGYVGPAPIKGHGPHRYVFQLFALAEPALADGGPGKQAAPRALLAAVRGPVLARGRLTGSFER
jgi:phosphatidylethanolamine-binding protein (PEBP) family uncharacterized protein